MIKKLFFLFSFMSGTLLWCQTSEDFPASWVNTNISSGTPYVLPPLDLDQIYNEDAINDLDKSMPWRYGIERSITINTQSHGNWTNLDNGDQLWTVEIESPGAINISVNFSTIKLPNGGSVFIYNKERSDITRGFFRNNVTSTQPIASWYVEGDKVIVAYTQPSGAAEEEEEEAIIKIESIIHGYRNASNLGKSEEGRGLNNSGACNYDVNCDIGSDFEDKKNMLKKSVALLNLGNGFLCSATLVNNVLGDKTPYLLTANHCLEGSNPALWVTRFNWINPNPVCATNQDSETLNTNFTISGATLKASNTESDFALVTLNSSVPDAWDVSFSGWDARDILPEFSVGIHHPQGDVMKVCRDNTGAVKQVALGTQVWLIGGQSIGEGNGWEIGTTESGSSGSPLFNEDGCIIGQLLGGESSCIENNNNNEYDVYGRFGVAWDSGESPQTRLKDWLDPLDQGILTLGTLQNNLSIQDVPFIGALEVYPNPVSQMLQVSNTLYPNLSFYFYSVSGNIILQGDMSTSTNSIDVSSLQNGVYFLVLLDEDSQSSITKKIVVAH